MGKSWFAQLIGVQYANFDGKQRAIMQISNLLGAIFMISWAVAHVIDIWSISSWRFAIVCEWETASKLFSDNARHVHGTHIHAFL